MLTTRELLDRGFRVMFLLLISASVQAPALGITYYLAVDVPTRLGGDDYTTNLLARSDNAVYALEAALPAGTELSALHRRSDGAWLFAPAVPLTLGAVNYEPRDLVAFDGASFTIVLNGASSGVPESARIDSLLLDGDLHPVVSFDVPVEIGATQYGSSDLVHYDGAFSLFWAGGPAGVPASGNLVGAALDDAGTLVVTFDVPTRIGRVEFVPGQLVRWNAGVFGSYFADGAWPLSSQLRDFAFIPGAGAVPNGAQVPGVPLVANVATGGRITLSWGDSCEAGDDDYGIYEGVLGNFTSHAPLFCSTAGATSLTFTPSAGNRYYLVVPRNALREGSYGLRSDLSQRPQGVSACMPQQLIVCP